VPESPHLSAEALLSPRLEQRILPGLERVQLALAALGQPQRAFPSVLVLGTNGKGSTAALLASLLSASGVRVGLYTSPHLVRLEERIQVAGRPIPAERLRTLIASLESFPALSYFETLTVAAFLEFAAQRVEVAVIEAGLGGRWDAAATCEPVVSLLTNVGTDHQRWLGESRAEIAAEKAAALRGRMAIVGEWDEEVETAIRREASAPLTRVEEWARVEAAAGDGQRDHVEFTVGKVCGRAVLPLAGAHQRRNAALALAGRAALSQLGIVPPLSPSALTSGISGVRWPGRWQWLHTPRGRLLLDGAHNREAMTALAASLDTQGLAGVVNLVFSCLDDKPLEAMARVLNPRVRRVVVVPLASPRATDLATLAAAFPGCATAPSIAEALAMFADDPAPILLTGSLRLVGEALAWAETLHE
jgi:dihydrofolate synthase/folylpolyglutamate synthase